MLYICRVQTDSLDLVCQVPCEKNVLAASIAAGPGKLAVAAILAGRVGIYVDIVGGVVAREHDP